MAPVDVVIFAALGDVLGRLDETIRIIRQYVKPGGYLVISDAYIDGDDEPDESALIVARAETLAVRYPDQAEAIMGFAQSQTAENEYIEDNLIGAIWVLQRVG